MHLLILWLKLSYVYSDWDKFEFHMMSYSHEKQNQSHSTLECQTKMKNMIIKISVMLYKTVYSRIYRIPKQPPIYLKLAIQAYQCLIA